MAESVRSCGTCTKCCEGYLRGEKELELTDGRKFLLGPKPCPFIILNNGCTEYDKRPQEPCRGFECEWLRQPDVYPEEMRPDKINAIFSLQEVDGIPYLRITEAGARLDAQVLSHAIKITLYNKFNVYWEVEGNIHWFGNKDFVTVMNKYKKNSLKGE